MFFKKFASGSILTYQITNRTFPPKKQFWADLSHSFSESITATQLKFMHLFGAKPPALRAPGPPDAPNNGDAC